VIVAELRRMKRRRRRKITNCQNAGERMGMEKENLRKNPLQEVFTTEKRKKFGRL